MTDFRLFSGNASGQTNRGGFTDDLGVQFVVTTDGVHDAVINGFYFWAPSTGDFDHTKYSWRLYSSTNGTSGTLISGSTTNVAVDFTANSWNYQALASPITLTNGTTYYAVLHSTSTNASHYTGTDNYWSSGAGASGISAGPITAPGTATALNGAQCAYNEPSASAAFPTSTLGTNYWLDVSISYDGPVVDSFTATDTWTCPTGVTSVDVRCWGGGGAGGTATGSSGTSGGGGAGGSFAESLTLSVTPSTVYTVTVGAGGVHDTTPTDGQRVNGGDSWFNTSSTIIAKGGEGGQHEVTTGNHGLGGTGSTTGCIGDTVYAGGSGAAGTTSIGGGGGGGAGTTGAGGAALGSTAGTGTSLLGGNGSTGTSGANASNASAYGGGGGGARTSSTTDRQGGNGAVGRVEIQWQIITAVSPDAALATATASAKTPTVTLTESPVAGKASVTAATLAPVVAIGVPAGKASVTAAVNGPTLALTCSPTAGVAAAVAAVNTPSAGSSVSVSAGVAAATAAANGAVGSSVLSASADVVLVAAAAYAPTVETVSGAPAGVAAAVVNANGCDFGDVEVSPAPATVRIFVYDVSFDVLVDVVASTAVAYDAVGQVAVTADAGLAEAVVDVSAVVSIPASTSLIDAIDVSASVNIATVVSSSNPSAGKASVVAAAFGPSLRIGTGEAVKADVLAFALGPTVHVSGGTSDIVRVLRVALTAERTYRIPHEIREIKARRT